MSSWPFHSELTLAAMPNAAFWARRHTEDVLAKWGRASLSMSARLVVSELVTNAVRETSRLSEEARRQYGEQPISVPYRELTATDCVRLRLMADRARLLAELWDPSEVAPVLETPELEAEGGRGAVPGGSVLPAVGLVSRQRRRQGGVGDMVGQSNSKEPKATTPERRPRATCPQCGRSVTLTLKARVIGWHLDQMGRSSGRYCEGAGKPPSEDFELADLADVLVAFAELRASQIATAQATTAGLKRLLVQQLEKAEARLRS